MYTSLPKINIIYDRYKKASSSRRASLEIRITYNKKQKYLSTGIMLYPNQWKDGKILNCPDIIQISQSLDKLLKDVRQAIYQMMKEGNIDIFAIPSLINDSVTENPILFFDFCKKRAAVRKYGKAKDTQERYDRFIRLFSEWGQIKTFEEVTEQNIIAYDIFLTSTGMKPYSKWNNYHRFLQGFIQDAINEGLLRRNPYNWLNIEKEKASVGLDKCLTPSELKQLRAAQMPTEHLDRVRDLFVFQTYTCLRYSDLARFDHHNITIINGIQVYKCAQKKTGKPATIPLLQPAISILQKYNNVLPIISNAKYNEYLKVVAQAAGLNYPLSTHWARHTGATLLLNGGVPMQIVSKICGHSSTKITEQVYAKLLDETVVDAVANIH